MFHMGWFVAQGLGVQGWGTKWAGDIGHNWMYPELYIDMARSLENACFDYIMIEDSLMIADAYGSSMEYTLAKAQGAPKNDPMPMIPLIAQGSKHIGVVGTLSAPFYPPFTAARLGATLDHLTHGRVGLNVVTSSSHRSAQNYGLDKHIEHDERYRIADEWMEVCNALWNSWEPDAVKVDVEKGIYADFSKVHTIDFKGKYFASRGPLNTIPGPQRRPVICQAGGSPAGRAFSSKHADTIVASPTGIPAMKAYRDDISKRMIEHGRDPKDCKVLYLSRPIIAETDKEAKEKHEAQIAFEAKNLDAALGLISYFSGIDMSKFDLDEPLPHDISDRINGHQSTMAEYLANGKTLREMATFRGARNNKLVGSPDTLAGIMGEIMEEVGGDGFLIANAITRRSVSEIADGLAPALKRRKLIRDGYEHKLFRDNLLAF